VNEVNGGTIALRAVTADNFEAVANLAVHAAQRDFIATNAYSIAQASFHSHYVTRAVYRDDVPVGFAMYVSLEEEGYPGEYGIYRLMIDAQYQRQGLGRRVVDSLLDEIRGRRNAACVLISHHRDNAVARELYRRAGFVETGVNPEGETVAQRLL